MLTTTAHPERKQSGERAVRGTDPAPGAVRRIVVRDQIRHGYTDVLDDAHRIACGPADEVLRPGQPHKRGARPVRGTAA